MTEQKSQSKFTKLCSFFQEAPKQVLNRTKSTAANFTSHLLKEETAGLAPSKRMKGLFRASLSMIALKNSSKLSHLMQKINEAKSTQSTVTMKHSKSVDLRPIERLKLLYRSAVSLVVDQHKLKTSQFLDKIKNHQVQDVQEEKVEDLQQSLVKLKGFFRKASDCVGSQTSFKFEGFKRELTAQSRRDYNNSSLAMSQLEEVLVDRNAASYNNMTLELSMNNTQFHPYQAYPSKDMSGRDINFDLTVQAPIAEESILDLKNQNLLDTDREKDKVIEDQSEQKQEQQKQQDQGNDTIKIQEQSKHSNKLMDFIVNASTAVQRKSVFSVAHISAKLIKKQRRNKQMNQFTNLIQQAPGLIKQKTLSAFEKFNSRLRQQQTKKIEQLSEVIQQTEYNQTKNEFADESNVQEHSQDFHHNSQENEFVDETYNQALVDQSSKRFNQQPELTNIHNKTPYQDSSYSDASQIFNMMNNEKDGQNILVQENFSDIRSVPRSKIFDKEEVLAQYEQITQEISQLQIEKQNLKLGVKPKIVIQKKFKPNYKKMAEISDDNEAIFKAKSLVRKMNFERKLKASRIQQQHDKLDQLFMSDIYQVQYNQQETKQRYEENRKQQIQNRIDNHYRKQREFQELQNINQHFVKNLLEIGPQQGKLAQEVEDQASQIKGTNRKIRLKGLVVELPKLKQSNIGLRKFMNKELAQSYEDRMIEQYEKKKSQMLRYMDKK